MFSCFRVILKSMRGAFLPYNRGNAIIPGGRVRIDDLSYYGINHDRKHLREDMIRVGSDFKHATKEAKSKLQVTD